MKAVGGKVDAFSLCSAREDDGFRCRLKSTFIPRIYRYLRVKQSAHCEPIDLSEKRPLQMLALTARKLQKSPIGGLDKNEKVTVTVPSECRSQNRNRGPPDWNPQSVSFCGLSAQEPTARAHRLSRMRFGLQIARTVVVWRRKKDAIQNFAGGTGEAGN